MKPTTHRHHHQPTPTTALMALLATGLTLCAACGPADEAVSGQATNTRSDAGFLGPETIGDAQVDGGLAPDARGDDGLDHDGVVDVLVDVDQDSHNGASTTDTTLHTADSGYTPVDVAVDGDAMIADSLDAADAAGDGGPADAVPLSYPYTGVNLNLIGVYPEIGTLPPAPSFLNVYLHNIKAAGGTPVWKIGPPNICYRIPSWIDDVIDDYDWTLVIGTSVRKVNGAEGICTVTCTVNGKLYASVNLQAYQQTIINAAGSWDTTKQSATTWRFLSKEKRWEMEVGTLPERRHYPMMGIWKQTLYILGGTTRGSPNYLKDNPDVKLSQCPEVVTKWQGDKPESIGCYQVRAVPLGKGSSHDWKGPLAKLKYTRWGLPTTQVGSELWMFDWIRYKSLNDPEIVGLEMAKEQLKSKKMITVYDMATNTFKPRIGDTKDFPFHGIFYVLPMYGGRLIEFGWFDFRLLDVKTLKMTPLNIPLPCGKLSVGMHNVITTPDKDGPIFMDITYIKGLGMCDGKGPAFDKYIDQKTGQMKYRSWFRWQKGKWSIVLGTLAAAAHLPLDQVFHTPDGVFAAGSTGVLHLTDPVKGDATFYPGGLGGTTFAPEYR